jgi:hypothetical protein
MEMENRDKLLFLSSGFIIALVVHLNPSLESEIEAEVSEIVRELEVSITLGREGMKKRL